MHGVCHFQFGLPYGLMKLVLPAILSSTPLPWQYIHGTRPIQGLSPQTPALKHVAMLLPVIVPAAEMNPTGSAKMLGSPKPHGRRSRCRAEE
jgi:hypothetical protein